MEHWERKKIKQIISINQFTNQKTNIISAMGHASAVDADCGGWNGDKSDVPRVWLLG